MIRPLKPGAAARLWLFFAGAAAVLSIGLPWAPTGEAWKWMPGYFTPGFCSTVYDYDGWASVECMPTFVNSGIYPVYDAAGSTGAQHPARALIAMAAVLVVLGYRQANRRLLAAAVVVAGIAFVAFGVHPAAGQLAFGISIAALVMALRSDNLLSRFPDRSISSAVRR